MRKAMVFGTFDILHPGHLNFFKQAKKYGDKLIVVIGRDKTIKKVKGHLPLNSEKQRQKLVSQLRLVDEAVLGNLKNQLKVITKFKPDIICLGYDQKAFVAQLRTTFPHLKIIRLKAYKTRIYKSSKFKFKQQITTNN